jgi:hypothetical protein
MRFLFYFQFYGNFITVLRIRPYHFSEKQGPDPNKSWMTDPHTTQNSRDWRLKMELWSRGPWTRTIEARRLKWRRGGSVDQWSQICTALMKSRCWIRILIKVNSRIRIWIRIVEFWIRYLHFFLVYLVSTFILKICQEFFPQFTFFQ